MDTATAPRPLLEVLAEHVAQVTAQRATAPVRLKEAPMSTTAPTTQLERTAWARELGVTITVTHAATPGGPRTTLETRTIDPTRETP